MSDKGKIIIGLIIFVFLGTFPFWYGRGGTAFLPPLSLDTPEIKKMAVKKCLEPTEFMRTSHMELLNSWREAVVRYGKHFYINQEGKKISMNLSLTCLGCHSNKDKFCDVCHNFSGVKPNCWSCHLVPGEVKP